MFRQSLSLIFAKGSRNHSESELLSLLPPFLAHLDNLIILIEQLTDKIMLDVSISVLNVVIPHTSNGVAPFTPAELVMKQHQDTPREHVMNASTMMEFVVILTSRENMMEILQESVNEHVLFMYVCFPSYLN
jgi:hypothetical protein